MTKLSSLLLAGLALTALAVPAEAAIYSTNFTGTVTASANTTNAVGSTITGAFTYSTDTSQFIAFRIDGFTATQPFTSVVTTVPANALNPYSAFYEANQSVTQGTGAVNRTFTLDLEALTNFTTSSALTLLTSPTLLAQIDTNPADSPTNSTFGYYNGPGNGTGVTSLTAALTSISTTVPEPASLALLAAPVLGMALRRRR